MCLKVSPHSLPPPNAKAMAKTCIPKVLRKFKQYMTAIKLLKEHLQPDYITNNEK